MTLIPGCWYYDMACRLVCPECAEYGLTSDDPDMYPHESAGFSWELRDGDKCAGCDEPARMEENDA